VNFPVSEQRPGAPLFLLPDLLAQLIPGLLQSPPPLQGKVLAGPIHVKTNMESADR
jgi:hypothetical protein